MLRLASRFACVVVVTLVACGGRLIDEGPSGEPAPRPPGNTETRPPSSPTEALPGGTASPPPTPPAGPLPSGPTTSCGALEGDVESNLAAYAKARAIGTYDVVQVIEECSGAGGLHVTLQRRLGCASAEIVHYGEHTCYDTANAWAVGDRAVVGVTPESGSVSDPGWCLEDVEAWDGVARAIRKLTPSESDLQALSIYGCVQ